MTLNELCLRKCEEIILHNNIVEWRCFLSGKTQTKVNQDGLACKLNIFRWMCATQCNGSQCVLGEDGGGGRYGTSSAC